MTTSFLKYGIMNTHHRRRGEAVKVWSVGLVRRLTPNRQNRSGVLSMSPKTQIRDLIYHALAADDKAMVVYHLSLALAIAIKWRDEYED